MYSHNTEIRHIAATDVYQLAQILEHTNSWKKLMGIIPKSFASSSAPADTTKKYNSEQIRLIENASLKQNRTGTEILFDEWGTSGKIRPTLGNLLQLLVEAELFRAADYVAVNFLKESIPERPSKGPAAKIDISLPFEPEAMKEVDAIMQDISYPESSILIRNANQPSNMNNYDYYTKLGPERQKVETTVSDLIKFSTHSIVSGELPNLSALGTSSTDRNDDTMQAINESTNTRSDNATNSKSRLEDDAEIGDSDMADSCNIPALSALQMHSTNSSMDTAEHTNELPNLSALNLNVTTRTPSETTDIVADSGDREHHLNVPYTSNGLYDSDNNLTPDLSILDQSSLDDSSLTNVTETSDDLSFDAQTRLNLSENNIPMLSILQK